MKLLPLLAFTFFSINTWADNMNCTLVDTNLSQDTLEFVQEGKFTYAYYSDGSSQSMECEVTADDGYLCEGAVKVRMYGNGETIVTRNSGEEVEFNCY